MKIALVRRQFSATGGAELYVQRLLGALAQNGHEVHLIAETWPEPPPGIVLHRVPGRGSRAIRAYQFALEAQDEIARHRFDCVFSLERGMTQDVYRAGDGVHRVWLERRRQFAPWYRRPFVGLGGFHRIMKRLEAKTFNPANTRRIIVNSEMIRREIVERFQFPAERILLVRNGIDSQRFQSGERLATRARFGVQPDDYLLLFVGSGWERKGLPFLLQAMARTPAQKLKLLVVGKDRPPRNAPANVIFAGSMEKVEDAYAAADLFVFLPIYDPAANVVMEALAAGLPVVTTSTNGSSEVLQPGVTGTVIEQASDIDAVNRSIEFWRGRPRPRSSAQFTLERNVEETLRVLEKK